MVPRCFSVNSVPGHWATNNPTRDDKITTATMYQVPNAFRTQLHLGRKAKKQTMEKRGTLEEKS